MKPLTKAIHDYIALRRSLGFKLDAAAKVLAKFAAFMEQQNADCITTQLALDWAQQPGNAQRAHWAQRLSYVRCFARHHVASDPKTEVPPPGLLPFRAARAHPYLYSLDEIERLLEHALQEGVDALLRAPDLRTRSGRRDQALMLLAVQTGLRLSEITGLCRGGVCLSTGAHVRVVGKGRKER